MSGTTKVKTATKRFKFAGEVYEFAEASEVTMRDLLGLEAETEQLGRPMHMGKLIELGETFRQLTPAEAQQHPEALWMLAVTIWLAMVKKRRDAGDLAPISFGSVIDYNLTDFEAIPDPADHADPRRPRPTKKATGAKSTKRRGSASGRVAASAAAE